MYAERAEFDALRIEIRRMMDRWLAFTSQPRRFGTARRIYPSEIAALEAISRTPRINITALAANLGVTKGAASQTVGKLVRKRLVRKAERGQSAREVCLELTATGRTAAANSRQYSDLAHRLFQQRHGRNAGPRIRQLQAAFAEFAAFFDVFVRHCPPDFPIAAPAPARARARGPASTMLLAPQVIDASGASSAPGKSMGRVRGRGAHRHPTR